MPKITKHGGPTIYTDTESFLDSLGEPEVEEVETSVGDNWSKYSRPTPTIAEILGTDPQ